MKADKAKKAREILSEIETLEHSHKLFSNNEHGKYAHFELAQHYNVKSEHQTVIIPIKYNQRFVDLLNIIITELKIELEAL